MKRRRDHSSKRPSKKRRTGDYQKGRELTKAPKSELKAFDVTLTTTVVENIANTPNFNTINVMVNGAELFNRVGRKVYNRNLHFRGWFSNAATGTQDIARVIIYYDAQPNGAAPTIANLLADSTTAGSTTSLSEINLFNRARFKILRDHQVLLPGCTNSATSVSPSFVLDSTGRLAVDFFIKLKGLESVYNGTNGGTVADITSGAIGFVVLSETTSNSWDFNWSSRLRYYD